MLIDTYKGYEIHLDNKKGQFQAIKNMDGRVEVWASQDTLEKLKKEVDKLLKKTFPRQPALLLERWASHCEISPVEITSVHPGSRYGTEAWVVHTSESERGKGSREKVSIDKLIKLSSAETIKRIQELIKKREEIDKEVDKLEDELERFELKDFEHKEE